jgi:RNA polymerase sigma factor for flagellar operon FliA
MAVLTRGKYSPEERERLIVDHLPHVQWIAHRVHEKIQGRADLDDLISVGTMGLIAAIDRFDPMRNLQLKTYAERKIRGAILDHLRSLDSLSRDDRRRTKETESARAGLERRLQRTATHAEVAAEMNLSLSEYARTLTMPGAAAPFSLDAEVNHTDGALRFSELLSDSAALSPEQEMAESELQGFVSNAIGALEPTLRSVISLHYAHGLTMRRIAPLLKMSEWQVQEARRNAIAELRLRLAQIRVHATPETDRVVA